ncbi:MAG: SusD/RagB family nutrient-binding outer membrane lipoprotein [Bacteroidetes bacterium]|nr:SusD/RagB family nutrient-binding outer membrane lipoprotein [Bacteroidota bacterium]
MLKNINNRFIVILVATLALFITSCTKKDFDINSPNPNQPSVVTPDFVLSAALTSTANIVFGGDGNFANFWMGYWAPYGEQSPTVLSYKLTTDTYAKNWDDTYVTLENYKFIEDESASPENGYFLAIAKTMKVFQYQRLVDLYNNIPYKEALFSTNPFPKFDSAQVVYNELIIQLDSATTIINNTDPATANDPSSSDVMFEGDMSKWIKFINTLKLKILMRQTSQSGGDAYIKQHLSGLTTNDFFGVGEDAAINPGYSNSSSAQQSPLWRNVGYNTDGSPSGGYLYTRANSYAVNFYLATNDLRVAQFYDTNAYGVYQGRAFGSSDVGQGNSVISGFGAGILSSATMSAYVIPAFESLFLQAEAAARNYISGDPSVLFKQAVTESFRILSVPDYQNAAQTYYSQASDKVNIDVSSNKINTIILQKWAASNAYDPLESYSDWRRLGIPADLPVSVYPGTTATHIPYRLLYPTSEYSYNTANVNDQGTINQFTSKIFWMP